MDVDSLANKIETYVEQHPNKMLHTFSLEFHEPFDMKEFVDHVFDCEEPYYAWGNEIPIYKEEETGYKYWKVTGNLFEVDEDGEIIDAPKLTIEFTNEWMRVYIDEKQDAERIAEFVVTLSQDYDFDARVLEEEYDEN